MTDASHGSGTQPFALFVSGGLGTNPAWTRTCSGTAGTCANARAGTSGQTYGGTAVNYFPSLKPLGQVREHVPAGDTAEAHLPADQLGAQQRLDQPVLRGHDMTGAAASNITVAFDQASPISLASGASRTSWPRSGWVLAWSMARMTCW